MSLSVSNSPSIVRKDSSTPPSIAVPIHELSKNSVSETHEPGAQKVNEAAVESSAFSPSSISQSRYNQTWAERQIENLTQKVQVEEDGELIEKTIPNVYEECQTVYADAAHYKEVIVDGERRDLVKVIKPFLEASRRVMNNTDKYIRASLKCNPPQNLEHFERNAKGKPKSSLLWTQLDFFKKCTKALEDVEALNKYDMKCRRPRLRLLPKTTK